MIYHLTYFGDADVQYFAWLNAEHTGVYVYFINPSTAAPQSMLVLPSDPDWGQINADALANVIMIAPPQPGSWYIWNTETNTWDVNAPQLLSLIEGIISQTRDAFLDATVQIVVGADTPFFKNDQRTLNALLAYNLAIPVLNDTNFTVKFIAEDAEGNDFPVLLDGAALQNVSLKLTLRMRAAFDAYQTVIDAHKTTPYVSPDAANSALQTLLAAIEIA